MKLLVILLVLFASSAQAGTWCKRTATVDGEEEIQVWPAPEDRDCGSATLVRASDPDVVAARGVGSSAEYVAAVTAWQLNPEVRLKNLTLVCALNLARTRDVTERDIANCWIVTATALEAE